VTLEIALLFAILGLMVWLFLTEKLPIDLTAFAGLVVLVFLGYVQPNEAFQGFASPAVITMLSIFVISGALQRTGVADLVGGWAHAALGGRETTLVIAIMIVAGVLSAFMNNIAATAVLMPAVAAVARRSGVPPSRLFMPLSFGAILGGTMTLVGTPPNILAGDLLRERGMEPFGLFDFTPIGATLLILGVVYMVTVGRRLLPDLEPETEPGAHDLARSYGLREKTFSIRVPSGSPMADRTLAETALGSALGVQVVAVRRNGDRILAPGGNVTLRAGDVLDVAGKRDEIEELVRIRDVEIRETGTGELPRPIPGVSGMRAVVSPRSPQRGRTLRELKFRDRYRVVVVGVLREGELIREKLAEVALQAGDELLALGRRERLEAFAERPEFVDVEIGLSALRELQDDLFMIHVPVGSALAGKTIARNRLGELGGVTVAAIVRGDETRLGVEPDDTVEEDDYLLVVGKPSRITQLLELGQLEIEETRAEETLESEKVGVVEATLAPRAWIAGKTIEELGFRERYGLQVLAIDREGETVRRDLAHVTLRMGDALLLQGPYERIALLGPDDDFLVLSEDVRAPRRTEKAPFAFGGLLFMIALVVSGWQPIHVASFAAATLTILTGALRMDEVYRAIEWRAIFLVAAVLPVGMAMERTGAALMLADTVTTVVGPLGPYAVLGALVVLSSLFSQGLDGAPAVVLLAPVGLQIASQLGMNPYAVMMGISIAASAAFMTPFSHKANLIVMGAGGYRSMDYVRVGTPLTIILLVVMTLIVPVFFPF